MDVKDAAIQKTRFSTPASLSIEKATGRRQAFTASCFLQAAHLSEEYKNGGVFLQIDFGLSINNGPSIV